MARQGSQRPGAPGGSRFVRDPLTGSMADLRRVQPFQASKDYVCPSCNQRIGRGVGHLVVVPLADPERGISLQGGWDGPRPAEVLPAVPYAHVRPATVAWWGCMVIASMTSSLLGSTTPSELVVEIFLALLFGWLGWRISRSFAASRGVTPWRLPSLVWALICFVLNVVGLVLELVAQLTTRTDSVDAPPGAPRPPYPQAAPRFGQAPPPYGQAVPPHGQAPPPYGQAPLPGSPAPSWPGSAPVSGTQGVPQPVSVGASPLPDEPAVPRLPSPPPGRDGSTALFGWYADVTRRHELRYWDGRGWTQFVRDAGIAAIDPV